MPVYEYKCGKCENVFSLMQRMGAGKEGVSCPSCKGTEVVKVMSLTYSPESSKAMPPSFESASSNMPKGMGGGGGCPSGMCGSGMCGI
jgi:putative FmdB family regulatory protein